MVDPGDHLVEEQDLIGRVGVEVALTVIVKKNMEGEAEGRFGGCDGCDGCDGCGGCGCYGGYDCYESYDG